MLLLRSTVLLLGLVACGPAPTSPPTRFEVGNPYAGVDWEAGPSLKVELHDHAGTDTAKLRAYDAAGYGAMSLMDYSGRPSLEGAWTARRWPPEQWLPAGFIASLQSVQLFLPSAEEVGAGHVVSPFLTHYISGVGGSDGGFDPDRDYVTTQECIDLIERFGGLAIVAHPWTSFESVRRLHGYHGIEVYSAFALYRREVTRDPAFIATDRNAQMVGVWDAMLSRDPTVRGIAVNDHFGPQNRSADLPARIRDSGKIVAYPTAVTLAALYQAIDVGRFLAVRDLGEVKDRYLGLNGIAIADTAIDLVTPAAVTWISDGRVVGNGPRLDLRRVRRLPGYVRAELASPDGSVVYTQAFVVAGK